jgi:hypothetical protein
MLILDPWLATIAVALCLVLIIFPGIIFRWATRRRQWSLGSLLTIPLITAVLLVTYRVTTIYVFNNVTLTEFLFGVVGLTVSGFFIVVFLRQLGLSLAGGRWGTFGFTLGIPVALVFLSFWLDEAMLDTSLRDPWDNWHRIVLAAIVLMGFVIVAWRLAHIVGSGPWQGIQIPASWLRLGRFPKTTAEPASSIRRSNISAP